MLDAVFFYAFALLVLGGALGTVTLRNPVHCAVSLVGSLLGVAGIFLLERAEFLATAQIIVYVGGIMLLFLFVIMLVNVERATGEKRFSPMASAAAVLAVVAGGAIVYLLFTRPPVLAAVAATSAPESAAGNTEQLGSALFTNYLLPFEIASVLLLAALIGSVILARQRA